MTNLSSNVTLLNLINTTEVASDAITDIQEGTASEFTENLVNMCFPSSNYINLVLPGESISTTYTAPANGWFVLQRRLLASGQISMTVNKFATSSECPQDGRLCRIYLPVSKNQTVSVWSAGMVSNETDEIYANQPFFVFIYAQGEVFN